jgi:hypothetical protein
MLFYLREINGAFQPYYTINVPKYFLTSKSPSEWNLGLGVAIKPTMSKRGCHV